MRRKNGFTIVELLIVIVVIAILAAISIVAYNGIQQRAINSQMQMEAAQAAKLIQSYYATNGTYPPTPSGATSVCIGNGFTNYVNDANGDCWDTQGSVVRSVHPAFNTALETIGSLGNGTRPTIPYTTNVSFTGPVFSLPSESGANGKHVVQYWVYGTTCPSGAKVWAGTTVVTSRCAISLD
jgi:prepilin-type N-terminal cleavage/methylation domain-containing protein